ncbi:MAG: hypothetical protein FWD96_00575 [Defluviitaleaceae bacterium]|nr:hypothetical protein [Defluviitaleaceae bacterium]
MMNEKTNNPFHVLTPEGLGSQETVNLFVGEHTDLKQISAPGHTIVIGPRGVGKSMMFRYLMSDCQISAKGCNFPELDFWGVYLSVKNMPYAQKQIDLLRLEQHNYAYASISEHMMVLSVALLMLNQLSELNNAIDHINICDLQLFYQEEFLPLIAHYEQDYTSFDNTRAILAKMKRQLSKFDVEAKDFVRSISFDSKSKGITKSYEGLLFDYFNFLQPFTKYLLKVSGMPKTVYLLIDDAHMLSDTQTKILNMWISTRTSNTISLKISTEYRYKTFNTINGLTIDTPHDYYYVDLGTIYTSGYGKTDYRKRVHAIVERRFSVYGIFSSPKDFFPVDRAQEDKIEKIKSDYTKKYDEGKGRGNKRHDDAYRYARADYIKSLGGISKNSSTYSYSGFNQLVDLSSGAIRSFLQPAHEMFESQQSKHSVTTEIVTHIEPGIQSDTMRVWAEDFLYKEMDNYKRDPTASTIPIGYWDKLLNLIIGLGGLFRLVLLSDRSERRVFSFALSNPESVTDDVQQILDIGVNWGYFHRSTIGRKDSKFGLRTELYVMNRRLSPNWNLDPTGFAGYLFVEAKLLQDGMTNPASMLRRLSKNWSSKSEGYDTTQLSLLDLEPGANLPEPSALVTFPDEESENSD